MSKVELEFEGPFEIDHFFDVKSRDITTDTKLKLKKLFNENDRYKGIDKPGIYIWGFNYPDEKSFTPYYVGQITDSIIHRIMSHLNEIIIFKSKKYRRLSLDYMQKFYSEPTYPLYIEKDYKNLVRNLVGDKYNMDDKDWFKKDIDDFNKKVEFYNNTKFAKKENFEQNRNKYDSLFYLINEGFFRFYFSNLKLDGKIAQKNEINEKLMNVFEAYTKFNLNGRTGSMSISWEEMESRLKLFNGLTINDISVGDNPFKQKYFKHQPISPYDI